MAKKAKKAKKENRLLRFYKSLVDEFRAQKNNDQAKGDQP